MTDSTDRVLASIDEAIDGYVSEDWTVGDDAMRWRPEEPERLIPAWADFGYLTEHVIVRPPDGYDERRTSWGGGYPTLESVVDEFHRLLVDRLCIPPIRASTMDLYWCNWSPPEEVADGEPRWDDSMTASLERSREGHPEHHGSGPGPVAVARAAGAIADGLQAELEPAEKPLTARWNVDVGHVSGKRRNRR